MPIITALESSALVPYVRKRVAAYARVSTDEESAAHSFNAQVKYYAELIGKESGWDFAGMYSDLGISGTSIKNRDGFNNMLKDCRNGKIDIVLTKSISRFSRNTIDLLKTVRELREIGVEVRFERENISTFSSTGELMLTILASIAQEESFSISGNVKWAIRKGFEEGKNNGLVPYGYRQKNGQIVVVPEEARIVKLIFSRYLEGKTTGQILSELDGIGAATYYGRKFTRSTLHDILRQEKYSGCMVLQKYYIKDHISHRKCKNKGELPMYYVEDSHPAIIERSEFLQVREKIKHRSELGVSACGIKTNVFTGKIHCGICGRNYRRYRKSHKTSCHDMIWRCSRKSECIGEYVSEEQLKDMCRTVLNSEGFDESEFSENIKSITVMKDGVFLFSFADGRTGTVSKGDFYERENYYNNSGSLSGI